MKRVSILIAILALLMPVSARAACTRNASVTGSSTQIIGATAISGGRKYVSVQNTGTSGTIGCAFGSGNTATSANTIQLSVGQMYEYTTQQTGYPPQGDVSCYALTGTQAATACEY